MIEIKNCPICNAVDSAVALNSKDYFLTHEVFQIKKCASCGFLFTSPRPSDNKLSSYYESDEYISHSNATKGLINQLYQTVRNYTLRKKVNLIRKFKKSGNILDIGCGTGEFLHSLSKNNYSVAGIEPNKGAADFARTKYQLNVYDEQKLNDFESASFDVITLWHVLEHVPGLRERVVQLNRLLKRDGILIIAVPNPTSKDAIYYKHYWAAYDLPRHLYHFRKKDITSLFDLVNMQVVNIKPMVFDSFYVSLLSEKYKSGSQKFIRPFFIGLWSNINAYFSSKNYSSLIYIIQHKNS